MSKDNFDKMTADLYQQPEKLPEVFEPHEIKAFGIYNRFCIILSRCLDDQKKIFGRSRADIAKAMSQMLGESITKTMLDQWASQAKEANVISAPRLYALVAVTGDRRLVNFFADEVGGRIVDYDLANEVRKALLLKERKRIDSELEKLGGIDA